MSAPANGRVVIGRVTVEQRVLGEQGEAEGGEGGVDEVDDDDLGRGKEAMEASGRHRFLGAGALDLGVWEKTSR